MVTLITQNDLIYKQKLGSGKFYRGWQLGLIPAHEQLYPAQLTKQPRFKHHPYKARWGDSEPYRTPCVTFTRCLAVITHVGSIAGVGSEGWGFYFDNQPQNNDNLRAPKTALLHRFGPSVISEPVLAPCNQPFLNIQKTNQWADRLLSLWWE